MEITKESLVEQLEKLKSGGFNYLKKITAVDYVDYIQVVYILYNIYKKEELIVTVKLPAKEPSVPTVIKVYESADLYERELSEMFDIKISGRNIKRLLLEEWDGAEAPLRKSFVWGNEDYKKL
ncbi:MAG: NADH-quinone oxidoreductase subunit C [Candidatus Micrarchaeia archaeon]